MTGNASEKGIASFGTPWADYITDDDLPQIWVDLVNADTAPSPARGKYIQVGDGHWLIDWAGSQRWYRGEADIAQLEVMAQRAGGQVSLFRGGDRTDEVMHHQPRALKEIQQRLKKSFDPDSIFNPGRLYSWL